MFTPPLALASLSGEADAEWAKAGSEWAGCAFVGGVSLDSPTREAARELVARDRSEFLPDDPIAFIDGQLSALSDVDIRPGVNVRTTSISSLRESARVAADHDAILEVNAHCRQEELCAVGAGETLLRDERRLCEYVRVASETGATVGVKVRAETDVDLPALAVALESAGADCLHVDCMDTESVIAEIADPCGLFVIANNGVRDRATVREYLDHGADAVSVGRPSDNPRVLERVHDALSEVTLA